MRLDSISWKKAQEYFSKKDIAVLPIGSTENHGSHLALGTDFLVPCEIAKAIDEKCEAILVPGIPYGVADQHVGFPGTLTIGYDGLHMIVSKIVWQLYDYGVRKFIFLNGHGGNNPVLQNVGIALNAKGAVSAMVNWWTIAGELNPAWKGGHGAGEETAAMMAINPAYVHMEDYMPLVPGDLSDTMPCDGMTGVKYKGISVLVPRTFQNISQSGWFGNDDAKTATVEWGKEMLAATADYICDFINEFDKLKIEK